MFGSLNLGPTDNPDGGWIFQQGGERARAGPIGGGRSAVGGRVGPVVGRVCLCRYFHGAGHDQERSGRVCHRIEQLCGEQQHGNHGQFERGDQWVQLLPTGR